MPSNLQWTRSSYFILFFLFKYDAEIIKQPSSCSFGKKKIVKFWKINNHLGLVPPHEFGKVLVV